MTYCIGWRYRNTVYLVSDTVFTNAPSHLPLSTFGEAHAEIRGEQIAETALKITEVAPGVAVAIAGDVELAMDIVDFIRDHQVNFGTPNELCNLPTCTMAS